MIFEKYLRYGISLKQFKFKRTDKEFIAFLALLKENEKKSFNEITNYQFTKLKQQVKNAYDYTKFYRKKYDEKSFKPEDLKVFSDIKKIPILTRDELRKFSRLMKLNNFKGKLYKGYTSGTTGHPIELFFDKKTLSREWASICYQWARVGYNPKDGRVEFRGLIEKDIDYIFLPVDRILRINIIKMSKSNINTIINKIKKTKYQFFHGYPSALYKFAKILEAKKINLSPKAILLASEVLYDWQMETIDRVFPFSKKIIHYGQAEKVALGAWNNDRNYHFIPSYGLLEIDEENNEMIATGFINDIMPIIRYRLTDSIEGFQDSPLSPKKTLVPVVKTIHGRIEDYTYNSKGEMIPPAVVTFPFKKLKHIRACKIIQNSLIDFNVIFETTKKENSLMEIENIINDLKKIYGKDSNMKINIVDKIPVDKSGKFKWIESNFKIKE